MSDPGRKRDYDSLARERGGFGSYSGQTNNNPFASSSQEKTGAPGGFPDFDFTEFMNEARKAGESYRTRQQQHQQPADEEDDDDEEYDAEEQSKASGNFFNTFAGMFGFGGEKTSEQDAGPRGRPDANGVFGSVFEDM